MDAIRKTVSSVMGVFEAMSATPWPWKNSRRSVADHSHRQADGGVAVKDPLHPGCQLQLIDLRHRSPFHLAGGTARAAPDGGDGP